MRKEDKERIHRCEDAIKEIYKEIEDKVRKYKELGRDYKEIREMERRDSSEIYFLRDEIEEIKSKYLIEDAYKYDILLPDKKNNSDMWEQSGYSGKEILSYKGKINVKKEIQKEKREQIKIKLQVYSIISSLVIGLLGAITGLIAIIKK